MDKLKKPRGLIRYASLAEFAGEKLPPLFKRPRVIVYSAIMSFAAVMLVWGLVTMSPIDLKALHERSPLFVQMSDGNIQNKWTLKVVNKSDQEMAAKITVSGPDGLTFNTDKEIINIQPGNVGATSLFVRIPRKQLADSSVPVIIHVQDLNNEAITADYETSFLGPKKR